MKLLVLPVVACAIGALTIAVAHATPAQYIPPGKERVAQRLIGDIFPGTVVDGHVFQRIELTRTQVIYHLFDSVNQEPAGLLTLSPRSADADAPLHSESFSIRWSSPAPNPRAEAVLETMAQGIVQRDSSGFYAEGDEPESSASPGGQSPARVSSLSWMVRLGLLSLLGAVALAAALRGAGHRRSSHPG